MHGLPPRQKCPWQVVAEVVKTVEEGFGRAWACLCQYVALLPLRRAAAIVWNQHEIWTFDCYPSWNVLLNFLA